MAEDIDFFQETGNKNPFIWNQFSRQKQKNMNNQNKRTMS